MSSNLPIPHLHSSMTNQRLTVLVGFTTPWQPVCIERRCSEAILRGLSGHSYVHWTCRCLSSIPIAVGFAPPELHDCRTKYASLQIPESICDGQTEIQKGHRICAFTEDPRCLPGMHLRQLKV